MPRPGLLLGCMYPLLILKYSLTRSRLMVWASSQYSSTNALSTVRSALSEAAVAIGPFGLVWDQPSRINAVNGEAEEGYLADLLPALRARVPRGLEGYAPLRALLVSLPSRHCGGTSAPTPHSLKIDRPIASFPEIFKLYPALKGEVCRSFYHFSCHTKCEVLSEEIFEGDMRRRKNIPVLF